MESCYLLAERYLESIQSLSPIVFYKALDTLKVLLTCEMRESNPNVTTFRERTKQLTIKHLTLETLAPLLDKFLAVPGGFLGIAQHSTGTQHTDSKRKALRKIVPLLLHCSVTQGL